MSSAEAEAGAQLDPLTRTLRRERALAPLLLLFSLSGATSLVYQVVWARQLHLVFGTSTFAISTVLSSFMGGLALGGLLGGRVADRHPRPLALYGALELLVGAYALLFPALLSAAVPIYLSASLGPVGFGLLQLALVGALLVIPTAAMGATLPLLVRFSTTHRADTGRRTGLLYATNTAGAVLGAWAAGFLLLPDLGLQATTAIAAAGNLSLGAGALLLARRVGPADASDAPAAPLAPSAVGAAMALAGFAALVYEVAWTRVLGLVLGPSVYAFSTMLVAFLVGIALGGRIGGPAADRLHARGGARRVLAALAAVEVAVALTSTALMGLYSELPIWYVWLFDALDSSTWTTGKWVVSVATAMVIMTPPAVLMGAAFPLAVRAAAPSADRLGQAAGHVYGLNTLGGVLGAALAGFVLLPNLQLQGTLLVAGLACLLAAAILVRGRPAWGGLAALSLGLAWVAWEPPWDQKILTAGTHMYLSHFSDHSRRGIRHFGAESYDLLFYEEGLSSVVTVGRNHADGEVWLANNGKVEASSGGDMPAQVLTALLPYQFAPDAQRVLVIGLASGITAGAAGLLPSASAIDIVEIEPATVRAARFFDAQNDRILDDPRATVVLADGRNHLLRTPPQHYDVVISEPSNPWITGVANLFTLEFFQLGRQRLAPGGVWAQWVQTYGMDDQELRAILRTFAAAFDHVLVYATVGTSDLVLVGSEQPIRPTPSAARALLAHPGTAAALRQQGIDDEFDLLARYLFDQDAIAALAPDGALNTDDNMRVEYAAPLSLHRDTNPENSALLERWTTPPGDLTPAERARLQNARRKLIPSP